MAETIYTDTNKINGFFKRYALITIHNVPACRSPYTPYGDNKGKSRLEVYSLYLRFARNYDDMTLERVGLWGNAMEDGDYQVRNENFKPIWYYPVVTAGGNNYKRKYNIQILVPVADIDEITDVYNKLYQDGNLKVKYNTFLSINKEGRILLWSVDISDGKVRVVDIPVPDKMKIDVVAEYEWSAS